MPVITAGWGMANEQLEYGSNHNVSLFKFIFRNVSECSNAPRNVKTTLRHVALLRQVKSKTLDIRRMRQSWWKKNRNDKISFLNKINQNQLISIIITSKKCNYQWKLQSLRLRSRNSVAMKTISFHEIVLISWSLWFLSGERFLFNVAHTINSKLIR